MREREREREVQRSGLDWTGLYNDRVLTDPDPSIRQISKLLYLSNLLIEPTQPSPGSQLEQRKFKYFRSSHEVRGGIVGGDGSQVVNQTGDCDYILLNV